MNNKKITAILTAFLILICSTGTSFAQQVNPNYYYQNPGYYGYEYGYQPVYNQPVYYTPSGYNTYADYERKEKLKKALKYGAIGAGAGYFLSGDGNKGKNAMLGGGIGAALGYFLNNY